MLNEALENTINGLGYELVEASRDARGVLRVTIDTPGGVDTADCERVSNHLGYFLPVEGVDYKRLEVSSPGLDRPLTKPAHYGRFIGRKAKVQSASPIDGQRNFTGTITESGEKAVSLDVGGRTMSFGYGEIKVARLCHQYENMRPHGARKGKRRR